MYIRVNFMNIFLIKNSKFSREGRILIVDKRDNTEKPKKIIEKL